LKFFHGFKNSSDENSDLYGSYYGTKDFKPIPKDVLKISVYLFNRQVLWNSLKAADSIRDFAP